MNPKIKAKNRTKQNRKFANHHHSKKTRNHVFGSGPNTQRWQESIKEYIEDNGEGPARFIREER